MDKTRLSIDSLGESEVERLRDSLKHKEAIIAQDREIIKSLRQQVTDIQQDFDELEKEQQLSRQRESRLTKDLEQKNEHIEGLAHSLEEVEKAYDNLNKRYTARAGQIKEIFEDLTKTKKELERVQKLYEELTYKYERTTIQLEAADVKIHKLLREKQDICQPSVDSIPEVKSAARSLGHTKIDSLHFAIADEIGEIMDSSSALPMTPAKVNLDHAISSLSLTNNENIHRDFNKPFNEVRNNDKNDNDGRHYCPNHRPKTVEKQKPLDPIEEYKLRVARANELARRNKLTKPLHQTSYALELDTFDTNFNEHEIKRGNVAALTENSKTQQTHGPAMTTRSYHQQQLTNEPNYCKNNYQSHHQQTSSQQQKQQQQQRRALADRINTTPVAKRVYKKAEAFIV